MSSMTAEEKKLEFFETPEILSINRWGQLPVDLENWNFLEPSAGMGGLAKFVKFFGHPKNSTLIDMSEIRATELKNKFPEDNVICADFLTSSAELNEFVKADKRLVVMNPPFTKAYKHVEKAVHLASVNKEGSYIVIALVPLAVINHTSSYEFLKEYRPNVIPVIGRPSFTGDNKSGTRDVVWLIFTPDSDGRIEWELWKPRSTIKRCSK